MKEMKRTWAWILAMTLMLETGLTGGFLPAGVGVETVYAAQQEHKATASDAYPSDASPSDASPSDAELEEWENDGVIGDDRPIAMRELDAEDLPMPYDGISMFLEEPEGVALEVSEGIIDDPTQKVTFTYQTVSGEQKEYSFEPGESYEFHALLHPVLTTQQEDDGAKQISTGQTFAGAWVETVSFDLPVLVDGEEDTYSFFAESIENFHFTCTAQLSAGYQVDTSQAAYYRQENGQLQSLADGEDYDVTEDASEISFRCRNIGGTYECTVTTQANSGRNQALLFYSSSTSLGIGPLCDAQTMKETLSGLKEFEPDDIHIIELDATLEKGAKDLMLSAMDQYFSGNDNDHLSLIFYCGHGSANVDGTSALALGNTAASYLSAEELRDQLNQYSGRFTLILASCFSGGMFRHALTGQEQEEAFGKNFVSVFEKSAYTRNGYNPNRFKIFASAGHTETSSIHPGIEGNLLVGSSFTAALERGLGYNRLNDGEYQNCASDLDGDYQITVKELSNFLKKQGVGTTPVTFPEEDEAVLFTYDEDKTPAHFDAFLADNEVTADSINEDGTVTVTLPVQIRSCVTGTWHLAYELTYIQDMMAYNMFLKPFDFYDKQQTIEADAGTVQTINMRISIPEENLDKSMGIRIACQEADEAYFILPFSVKTKPETDISQYLLMKEPYMSEDPGAAQVVYQKDVSGNGSTVPITVRFDQEPAKKSGFAACRLTLEIFRADSADPTPVRTLYEKMRPEYVIDARIDELGTQTYRIASYTYIWDFKDGDGNLCSPGVYKVVVTAEYDDEQTVGRNKSIFTFLNVQEMGENVHVIAEWDGHNVWHFDTRNTIAKCQKDLQNYNNQYLNKEVTQSVMNWRYLNDQGQEVSIDPADYESTRLMNGTTYISRIEASIKDDANAIFSPDCQLLRARQRIENVNVSEDCKTMTYDVFHHIPQFDASTDLQITGNPVRGGAISIQLPADDREFMLENVHSFSIGDTAVDTRLIPDSSGVYHIPENCRFLRMAFHPQGGDYFGHFIVDIPLADKTPDPVQPEEPSDFDDGESDLGSSEDEAGIYSEYISGREIWSVQTAEDGTEFWRCMIPGVGYAADNWYQLWWNGTLGWYRFDGSGRMLVGWYTDLDGRRYYLNTEKNGTQGMMLTGWQQIDGQWYYFYPQTGGPMGSLAE